MLECVVGEVPFLGLDAAPLERESMRIVEKPFREVEVFAETMVMIAGRPGGHRDATFVLPRRPVVVGVAPLDLMCRSRRAPEEALRELEAHGIRSHDGNRRCGRGLGALPEAHEWTGIR